MSEHIWFCKIGGEVGDLPSSADGPMREAITRAYRKITGSEPGFLFSGWGGTLTEPQRAVVEDRPPSAEYEAAWHARHAGLVDADAQGDDDPEAPSE